MNNLKKIFKDTLIKKLLKNASILLSGNVIAQVLGLVSLILTTRLLGPELFGILIVIQNFTLIVDGLINFQSWQALIKFGIEALGEKQTNKFKGYIKFGVILDLVTAIIATALAVTSIQFIGPLLNLNHEQILMASLYSLTILFHLSGTPTAILRIYDKFKLFTYQQVIASIIKLIGVSIAVIINADIWFILGVWIITDIVGYIILVCLGQYILYKNKVYKWWLYKVDNWKQIFRFTWWTNLTSTFDVPVKQLDMIIISSLISFEAVSIYKVFKQIANIIGKVADPIYQAIYPQLVKLITDKGIKRAFFFSLKSGFFISGILLPVILMVIVFSPLWLNIFGELFATAWYILAVYLILRLISVTFICIHPLFVAMGFVKQNVIILFVSNLIYILLTILLGKSFGLIGIVSAYGFQFITVIVLKILYIINKMKTNPQREYLNESPCNKST